MLRTVLLGGLVAGALARPEFPARIPNGMAGADPSSGISCEHLGHQGCVAGAPRNQFGLDFMNIGGLQWTPELCQTDSDGDGLTNGEELGDPCCLWTPDSTSPPGFRVDNLSHPGEASETASDVPGCPNTEPPATDPPATEPPATEPPVTEPPVSEAPVSEAPVSEAPVTEAPVTEAPVTEAPVTEAPVTEEPVTDAPVTEDPVPEPAAAEAPVTDAPAPVTEAPATVTSAPATDAPMTVAPAPVTNAPRPDPEMPVDMPVPTGCDASDAPCGGRYASCCDSKYICTASPWEGEGEYRCLPRPPTCYENEMRCAGAPGKTYVPYADCCNRGYACVANEGLGYGRFCLPVSMDYDFEEDVGSGAPSMEPVEEASWEPMAETTASPAKEKDYY